MAAITQTAAPGRPDSTRRGSLMSRRWTVIPATYLVAIVAIGITIVPLLFVVVDGFRTNGDINNSPAGWPHPWVASNYTSILTSAPFWEFRRVLFRSAAMSYPTALVSAPCVSRRSANRW